MARALARDPRDRYEDAAEMEDALADGLAGIGGTSALESTRMLPPTDESTRMLDRTQAGPPTGARRRLQPIDEPPAPRRAPARRAPAGPPPRKESSGAGKWIALVLVLLLIAGGAYAFTQLGGERQPQLNENVEGTVPEAVDSFKQLVEDNTR